VFPISRLTDITVTGDPIEGPGMPNVLIGGLPAACVGDIVAGPVITGVITMGSMTVLIGGRPAAHITSMVDGVNTETGIPLTSAIALGEPTVLVGE
jgi:uncharacterized Zn-binding protein involved in type VI secretion